MDRDEKNQELMALFHTLGRTFARGRPPLLPGAEPPPGQPAYHGRYRILCVLSRFPEGIPQNALPAYLDIRQQSLSESLMRMEEEGLIRREADPQDKRRMNVYLTEAGVKFREKKQEARRQANRQIFSCLTDAECETLSALLTRLAEARTPEDPPEAGPEIQ